MSAVVVVRSIFDGQCAVCRRPITIGDRVDWRPLCDLVTSEHGVTLKVHYGCMSKDVLGQGALPKAPKRKIIASRFRSTCRSCQDRINEGDPVSLDIDDRWVCLHCADVSWA